MPADYGRRATRVPIGGQRLTTRELVQWSRRLLVRLVTGAPAVDAGGCTVGDEEQERNYEADQALMRLPPHHLE
jgi:hypothetical protein